MKKHIIAVSVLALTAGAAMAQGVEKQVKAYATRQDKPVAFLETLEEQLLTLVREI